MPGDCLNEATKKILYFLVLEASLITSFFTLVRSGFFIEHSVETEFIILLVSVNMLSIHPLFPEGSGSKVYVSSIAFSITLLLAILSSGNLPALSMLSVTTVLQAAWIVGRPRILIYRWITSVSFFIFMVLASTLLRILPGNLSGTGLTLIVGSVLDSENPAGVPLLFKSALVLYGSSVVFTLSFQYLILISVLSWLIPENFYLIWKLFLTDRGVRAAGGTVRGVPSLMNSAAVVLSCQCEGVVASVPAISSLLVGILILPLIAESTLMLVASNLIFTMMLRRGETGFRRLRRVLNRIMPVPAVILLILLPPISIYGAMTGAETSIYYFYGLAAIMFLAGIIAGYSLFDRFLKAEARPFISMLSFFASATAMFIWFLPVFSTYAFLNYGLYALMDLSSIVAGIVAALGVKTSGRNGSVLFTESISMMFPLVSLVIFYYSISSPDPIWWQFPVSSQIPFAIIMLLISLPLLWLTTILSVSTAGTGDGDHARGQET